MNRLHTALAVVAALAASAAGVVDRQRESETDRTIHFISAPDLARRIMGRDEKLRLFDLRSRASFDRFHIPSASHVTTNELAVVPMPPQASVVLYGDARTTLVDGLRTLRARNYQDVHVLREGMYEWLSRVHEPRLAVDATPEERAAFEQAAAMSRFFGGEPRAAVTRDEVPRGYWTGDVRPEALLVAAAAQSVGAIRRRGC